MEPYGLGVARAQTPIGAIFAAETTQGRPDPITFGRVDPTIVGPAGYGREMGHRLLQDFWLGVTPDRWLIEWGNNHWWTNRFGFRGNLGSLMQGPEMYAVSAERGDNRLALDATGWQPNADPGGHGFSDTNAERVYGWIGANNQGKDDYVGLIGYDDGGAHRYPYRGDADLIEYATARHPARTRSYAPQWGPEYVGVPTNDFRLTESQVENVVDDSVARDYAKWFVAARASAWNVFEHKDAYGHHYAPYQEPVTSFS